jgi:hypothetical protein
MNRNNAPGTPSPKSKSRRRLSPSPSSSTTSLSNRTPRRPNRVLPSIRIGGINSKNVPRIFEGNGHEPRLLYNKTLGAFTNEQGAVYVQPRKMIRIGNVQRQNRRRFPNTYTNIRFEPPINEQLYMFEEKPKTTNYENKLRQNAFKRKKQMLECLRMYLINKFISKLNKENGIPKRSKLNRLLLNSAKNCFVPRGA